MAAVKPSATAAAKPSAMAAAMPSETVAAMALSDCNREWSRAADGSYSGKSNNDSKTAQPQQSAGVCGGIKQLLRAI